MKIWVNTIVNNEENFIWFAVMSVIDYVDKILIWDTGSTDGTVDIIKELMEVYRDKISFKEVGEVNKYQFAEIRQKMLEESECDWVLILDGDEIWWDDSIKKLREEINLKGNQIDGIVVPMVVPVGDIFHLQEERAGRYEVLGKKGHLTLKAFSKSIPSLHVDDFYGKEAFLDKDNTPIQEREKIIFLNTPFLHVTHLKRSKYKRKYDKSKYELGNPVSENFKFPEVFYKNYPRQIPDPFQKISGTDLIKAKFLTPLRKLKRRIYER